MKFAIVFDMSDLIKGGFLTEYPDTFDTGPAYNSPEFEKLETKYFKQFRPKKLMRLWYKLDIPVLGYECESADEFDENVRFHMVPREDTLPDNIPENLDVKMY